MKVQVLVVVVDGALAATAEAERWTREALQAAVDPGVDMLVTGDLGVPGAWDFEQIAAVQQHRWDADGIAYERGGPGCGGAWTPGFRWDVDCEKRIPEGARDPAARDEVMMDFVDRLRWFGGSEESVVKVLALRAPWGPDENIRVPLRAARAGYEVAVRYCPKAYGPRAGGAS